ncbi:MAG: ABC transporter permease [Pseudomonadota bacterium]
MAVLLVKSLGIDSGGISGASYLKIVGDRYTVGILISTLRLGAITTAIVVVIAYPIALTFLFATARQRAWLTFLVILPLLTSTVVRTFAWIVILGRDGPLNHALMAIDLLQEPLQLLFSDPGVIMAITQIELPLMILPLVTSLLQIDSNLLGASRSLGAGRWRTFGRVILPLSLPGLIAGCALVFASSVGAFITQSVIGGGKRVYMPLLIYQQATDLNDLRSAAALAVTLLAVVVLVVAAGHVDDRRAVESGWAGQRIDRLGHRVGAAVMADIGDPAAVLRMDQRLVGAARLQVAPAHQVHVMAVGLVLRQGVAGPGRQGERRRRPDHALHSASDHRPSSPDLVAGRLEPTRASRKAAGASPQKGHRRLAILLSEPKSSKTRDRTLQLR